MRRIACCFGALVAALGNQASGQVLYTEDFNASDGGYAVVSEGGPGGPWAYNGGGGTWRADGSETGPSASRLTSPLINFTQNARVRLELTHRYSFEYDGTTRWDGGQIRVSKNGGAFSTVTSDRFVQNGYAPGTIGGNNILNGQAAFNDNSPGYAGPSFIASIANLGNFASGDTLQVELVGAWDESVRGSVPNWEVDALRLLGERIADSFDDWSTTGTQGERNWFNGYYDMTVDGDATYTTGELTLFQNLGGPITPAGNNWDGAMWDLVGDPVFGPPWTELGREALHPAGDAPVHWPIRRWVSTYTGDAAIRWHMHKGNTGCGNGVTGRVLINGVEVDAATIAFNSGAGVTRTLLRPIAAGDLIELALDPLGTDAGRADACDGSLNRLTIEAGAPDTDSDGVIDPSDNCVNISNPSQEDADLDGAGDVCDNCPEAANPGQEDRDQDGMGNACDMVLADSIDDWSPTGMQGFKLWFNGYYNFTLDGDHTYAAGDFLPFLNDGTGVVSGTNHWGGDHFRLAPDAGATGGPWTFLGQEDTHPNGTNSTPGQEHWTIRRWISTQTVDAAIAWHVRKTNPNGTGTTGRLFINGVQVDSATIGGGDSTGVIRSYFAHLTPGTRIDLALTPEGADRGDGADGSATWMRIKAKVPCDSFNLAETIADSQADWSPTGTQGENGWSYGYYDVRADVETRNGVYGTSDFIPFLNDGSGVVSADPAFGGWKTHPNHWNGSAWDLLNNGVIFNGPWTELGPGGGHPAANAQGDPEVHWTIRRWTSTVNDSVHLSGGIFNGGGGDGTVGRIFRNGVQVFAGLTDGTAVNYGFNIALNIGDVLDFAIDPDGSGVLDPGDPATVNSVNDGADSTTFTARISRIEVFNPCPRQLAADCNQDGRRDTSDIVCYIGLQFPGFVIVPSVPPGGPCDSAAGNLDVLDINGDDRRDLSDIFYLAMYLFTGGPPPVQGTDCFDISTCDGNIACE